jgi:hypothetical protein
MRNDGEKAQTKGQQLQSRNQQQREDCRPRSNLGLRRAAIPIPTAAAKPPRRDCLQIFQRPAESHNQISSILPCGPRPLFALHTEIVMKYCDRTVRVYREVQGLMHEEVVPRPLADDPKVIYKS